MGRIIFLSAVAFLAYKYITRSNKKVQQLTEAPGTIHLLPPERKQIAGSATEALPSAKPVRRISAAVESEG